MAKKPWRNAVPTIVIALFVSAALTLVAVARFRRGATVLGAALMLTAAMRLYLPEDRMGPLAVRSRTFDVLFCGGLGSLLLYLVVID